MLIPVLVGVAVVIFTIMYFTPGDPITIILGENYTEEQYAAKLAEWELDKPYFQQLLSFLKHIFIEFNFGTSYIYSTKVVKELIARLPRTATIATVCCLLQILISIPLGVTAAVHQNGFMDRFCIFLAMCAVSLPSFWLAMILILIFSLGLKWLPSYGIGHWYSYILPCIANALMGIGGMARLTRSQMLEVIRSDYIVTARAKGVSERAILYSHALPNALIPVITSIGTHFGMALGGTVVIETVFAIPGVGYYMIQAIGNRDYPIIRGGVTLLALLFCLVMLVVDLIYAFIDPRIKAQYEGGRKKQLKKSGR
jgi:peptide/nickel transport system permease protein